MEIFHGHTHWEPLVSLNMTVTTEELLWWEMALDMMERLLLKQESGGISKVVRKNL